MVQKKNLFWASIGPDRSTYGPLSKRNRSTPTPTPSPPPTADCIWRWWCSSFCCCLLLMFLFSSKRKAVPCKAAAFYLLCHLRALCLAILAKWNSSWTELVTKIPLVLWLPFGVSWLCSYILHQFSARSSSSCCSFVAFNGLGIFAAESFANHGHAICDSGGPVCLVPGEISSRTTHERSDWLHQHVRILESRSPLCRLRCGAFQEFMWRPIR